MWMCTRLQMPVPDINDVSFKALQSRAVIRSTDAIKEPVPYPTNLIALMEQYACCENAPAAGRLLVGFTLCLIFASLRFDDGLHVRVASLKFEAGALRGICWQTKRDRARRGTHFAVPAVSLRCWQCGRSCKRD